MQSLETGYEAMVEIIVEAHLQTRSTAALASAAWWLSRRNILASAPYFAGVAAKMTNELGEVARGPLLQQLSKTEISQLSQVTDWPIVPPSITSILDQWNPVPEAPDDATLIRVYSDAIQEALNSKARERRYDSIQSAITYRGDPNAQFAAEADALFAWRSTVWTYSTNVLSQALAGEIAVPSMEDFLSNLPTFHWPDEVTDD